MAALNTLSIEERYQLPHLEASAVAAHPAGHVYIADDEGHISVGTPSVPDSFRALVGAEAVPAAADLEGLALSDDGKVLFVLGEGRRKVWRLELGEPHVVLHSVCLGKLPKLNKRTNLGWEGIAWAPRGHFGPQARLVAVHQRKPRRVALFDPVTLAQIACLRLPKQARTGLGALSDVACVSGCPNQLLVLSGDAQRIGHLTQVDGELRLNAVVALPEQTDVPEGLALTDDGLLWVATDGTGSLLRLRWPQ